MRHLNPRTVTALIAGDPTFSGRGAAQRAIDAFLDLPAPASAASAGAGYRTAWQLLASLCATGVSSSSTALAPDPVGQARAALNNLSVQFLTHMVNRLRGAKSASTHQRYPNFTANTAASYVDVSLSLDSDVETMWATVYYCLRAGSAVAAQHVLSAHLASAGTGAVVDDAVVRLLKAYADRQGGEADNMWENASSVGAGPSGTPLNEDDKLAVQELGSTTSNLFQTGTYALLSGSPLPSDDNTTGFCNIEDYLTSRLWLAVLDASSPQQKLADLGKAIRDFGPEYFGAHDPYSYAWPLLVTQQYASALKHLASAGGPMGLLQATHLALVLTGLLEIGVLDLGAGTGADASASVLTSLLVKYSRSVLLPRVGARAALEYLARIPTRTAATKAVSQLLASPASNLAELAGTINEQGVREGGAECLNTFGLDVSKVLSVAAEEILEASNVSRESMGRAMMCYMLGRRYAEVLKLLSRCLCPPEEFSTAEYGDRVYWVQQASDFRSHYLSKRTHVLQVLERDSPRSIATINALLGLNQFYGKLKAGQRDEGWELLAHSNLLPTSRTDLSTKEASYQTHDQLVQDAFPTLLTTAVANLFQEYQALRSGLQYPGGEVARTRIEQVKAQTKLYVLFAGMIGMTGEKMQALSRMEALMC
jgi:Nup93/Nic96